MCTVTSKQFSSMHISPKPLRARCRDYHDNKTTCIFGYLLQLLEVILFNLVFPAIGPSIDHIRIPGFGLGLASASETNSGSPFK